jgi:hypothetical protein
MNFQTNPPPKKTWNNIDDNKILEWSGIIWNEME